MRRWSVIYFSGSACLWCCLERPFRWAADSLLRARRRPWGLQRQAGLLTDLTWQYLLGKCSGKVNSALGDLIVVVTQADQLEFIAVMESAHRHVLTLCRRRIEE